MFTLNFAAVDQLCAYAQRLGAEGHAGMASCAVFLRRAAIEQHLHAVMPGKELASGRQRWQSALNDTGDADHGLVVAVIEFLARKSTRRYARKQDLLKLARELVEPAAIRGLSGFFGAETISLAFSDRSHSNDLLFALRSSMYWWGNDWNPDTAQFYGESHGRCVDEAAAKHGPPPTRAVIQVTHLVHEVLCYCHDYPVMRESKEPKLKKVHKRIPNVRTRDNAAGEQFCKFCPAPSARFVFVYRHVARCDALGTVLLACIPNAKGLTTVEYGGYNQEFCVSHCTIRGASSSNRGRREGDRKLQNAYELQRSSYRETLATLGLHDPRSGFLHRQIAWLRAKPSTHRLLAKSQQVMREKRPQAQHLVDTTFGSFPGFDALALRIDDALVEIAVFRSGRFTTANHQGVVRLLEDTGDGWKRWDQAFEDAQETLRHLINDEFCSRKHVAPSAIFQTLGLEVFLGSASIRFVFESPDLLDAARAALPSPEVAGIAEVTEAAKAENTAP